MVKEMPHLCHTLNIIRHS